MSSRIFLYSILSSFLSVLIIFIPLFFGLGGSLFGLFSPLPIMVMTLGFGTAAGLITTVLTSLSLLFLSSFAVAFYHLVSMYLPILWLGHLFGLMRIESIDGTDKEVWYPMSSIFLHVCFICFFSTFFIFNFIGFDSSIVREALSRIAGDVVLSPSSVDTELDLSPHQILSFIQVVMPISLFLVFLLNFCFGFGICLHFRWFNRPLGRLARDITFPSWVSIIYLVPFALLLLDGRSSDHWLAPMSRMLVGSFSVGYVFIGLCVVQHCIRHFSLPVILIPLSYCSLFFVYPLLIFLALGIFETLLFIRSRISSSRVS